MKYTTIDAEYPFEINLLCPSIDGLANALGADKKDIIRWEADGDIPSLSKTTDWHHAEFWTNDEGIEAFIKGYILQRGGN